MYDRRFSTDRNDVVSTSMERTNVIAVVLGVLSLLLLLTSQILSAAPSETMLTRQEVSDLRSAVAAVEPAITNIKIASEVWVETRMSLTDPCEPWKRTPIYVSSTTWISGYTHRKVRVDVHKEVLKWEQGVAPYADSSYSVSFDGERGKVIYFSTGHTGKTFPLRNATIFDAVPKQWQSGWCVFFTGRRFSTHFFSDYKGSSLSDMFKQGSDPNESSAPPYTFSIEDRDGASRIRIAVEGKAGHKVYWLDSSRGFALQEEETVRADKTGGERTISRMKVTKLKKLTPNVWWPIEAYVQLNPQKLGEPYKRTVYRVSEVIANSDDFDDGIFTVPVPAGYRVDDKTQRRP